MKEYINKTALMKKVHTGMNIIEVMQAIIDAPAADVVLRSCFDRILAENDDMREQLKSVGKLPGDDMSDLEVVRHGRWLPDYDYTEYDFDGSTPLSEPRKFQDGWQCSLCGQYEPSETNYCPNCGAKMNGGVNDEQRVH